MSEVFNNLPDTFVGQEKILGKINTLIDKANKSKKPLPHMLFVGEDGMGKKTLARMITSKLHSKIVVCSSPDILKAGDLIGVLTNLEERDIFFISDIDKISKVVEEFLYPAMESCHIDFVIDKGPYARTVTFNLKPFTMIATTSKFTKLSEELINRFYSIYKFIPYTEEDYLQILQNKAKSKGVTLDEEATKYFAKKLVVSTAKMFLVNRVVGFANVSDTKAITKEIIDDCLTTIEENEETVEEDSRRSIPNKVRTEVWRRDEGKCSKCGSRENLEYDHIIPISKGGSNTIRNIELLCEKCNREKKDNIQ